MLRNLIERIEEVLAVQICNGQSMAMVSVNDLRMLVASAELLEEIHSSIELVERFNQEWVAKADAIVCGVEEESL